jgi:hypothetical protein
MPAQAVAADRHQLATCQRGRTYRTIQSTVLLRPSRPACSVKAHLVASKASPGIETEPSKQPA